MVLKYINIGLKSSSLSNFIAKSRLKIVLYILSRNIAIATRYISVITVLKAKTTLLDLEKFILDSKKIIGYCKFNELKIIYKNDILFIIIRIYN